MIPEKPIVFSPTLAATLGLEEAILLQILQESVSHSSQITSSGYAWTSISGQRLLELSPFWNEQDIGLFRLISPCDRTQLRGVIGIFDKICPMHRYDNTPSPNGPMFLFLCYYAWVSHKNGCAAPSVRARCGKRNFQPDGLEIRPKPWLQIQDRPTC